MSVTAAAGFSANGVHCGIKPGGAHDLSTVFAASTVPTAAVFTTSLTAAPPVVLSRGRVAGGSARGVIVNSGSANAGTGAAGYRDAEDMTADLARALGCMSQEVLVCSTGPIGGRLPINDIAKSVPDLVAGAGTSPEHGTLAARGIMTTDSIPKEAVLQRHGVTVGGMAKGAGMVRPDMATMLAFITTDASVPTAGAHNTGPLGDMLARATARTFNALNIDGCQSTNDTVILMASGASGVVLEAGVLESMLIEVCEDLAHQMAADAEGASKVVTILVSGAASDAEARQVGMGVADSALVRSSFYGADPNWGRVLGALGVTGVALDPDDIEIAYEGTTVARAGVGVGVDEDQLSARLAGDFTLAIRIGSGPGEAKVVTTDLTPDYVVFNGERS
ncbi:MAG: bifunctional glutamate N-acetyltransferase/amino-acid acetyltransferase ArgJ [Acidimicrobiia bacterium]